MMPFGMSLATDVIRREAMIPSRSYNHARPARDRSDARLLDESESNIGILVVCAVHAPLIFQLRRSEADPRRSNELTEEYLTSSL